MNPAFDVYCKGEGIKPLSENFAEYGGKYAGGKGINVSAALSSASVNNRALVVLGEDGREEFSSALDKRKIVFDYVLASGRIRENLTHISSEGETRLSFGGLRIGEDALSLIEEKIFSYVSSGDVLVFSGSLPGGVEKAWAISLLKKVKGMGVYTVLDSRAFAQEDIIEAKPSLIKPNLFELCNMSDGEVTTVEAADKYLKHLLNRGVGSVLLSLGGEGARLASENTIYTCKAPRITPVSTVGAGDSAIAGFLYGMSNGCSQQDNLRYAVAFGSAACLEDGTKAPCFENVVALYKKTKTDIQ
jgi:1-phosphofructokinase family hexose kinase